MRSIPERSSSTPIFYADPDSVARVARLGAIVDRLVPDHQSALIVTLARCSLGWTQSDLAAATGLSRTQIARIEAGRTRVKADRAGLLSEHLDVPADLLES